MKIVTSKGTTTIQETQQQQKGKENSILYDQQKKKKVKIISFDFETGGSSCRIIQISSVIQWMYWAAHRDRTLESFCIGKPYGRIDPVVMNFMTQDNVPFSDQIFIFQTITTHLVKIHILTHVFIR